MKNPQIDESAYINEKAFITGDVEVGANSSIWPFASLRGDRGKVEIGKYTNIQDNISIHNPTSIGDFVSVGHNAVLHGCTVQSNVIVGMHATILDNTTIGSHCVIGAHALVPEEKEIPDNSLVLGVPGKVVKTLDKSWQEKIQKNAEIYYKLSREYIQRK